MSEVRFCSGSSNGVLCGGGTFDLLIVGDVLVIGV